MPQALFEYGCNMRAKAIEIAADSLGMAIPVKRKVLVAMMKLTATVVALAVLGFARIATAGSAITPVPMTQKGSKTFYVSGWVAGIEPAEFMVDTGSSYMTINQVTLDRLKDNAQVNYLRDLTGVLANGDEVVMPVYSIPRIVLGNRCELIDLEAVVFPGNTRQILGLSVLRKAAPFMFSVDPPELQLSNCRQQIGQYDH